MSFAKPFDKVPHKRLLFKLHFYMIRGSTHKWIALWLSERYQKVVLDGQASPGLIWSPQNRLIFINDLPDNIKSSARLFVDYLCAI